jgi:iron complex transport system substrate-binding protein
MKIFSQRVATDCLVVMFFLFFGCVSASATRIVCINSNAMEVLRVLNATDQVVGVHNFILKERGFWAELAERPNVGDWREPDYEAILALKPDVVLCYKSSPGPEIERLLEPGGTRILRLDFHKLPAFHDEVRELARLVGREAEAASFLAWFDGYLTRIRSAVAASPHRPVVYLEGYTDFRAAGPGSGFDMFCQEAGLVNIGQELGQESAQVTTEWILSRQPEAIIKSVPRTGDYDWPDTSPLLRLKQSMLSRPGWGLLEAVKKDRFFLITSSITAGPPAVVGLAHMVRIFHPEQAGDLDPAAMHAEYLARFHHLPLKGIYTLFPRAMP